MGRKGLFSRRRTSTYKHVDKDRPSLSRFFKSLCRTRRCYIVDETSLASALFVNHGTPDIPERSPHNLCPMFQSALLNR
jgi:hypothetical protein